MHIQEYLCLKTDTKSVTQTAAAERVCSWVFRFSLRPRYHHKSEKVVKSRSLIHTFLICNQQKATTMITSLSKTKAYSRVLQKTNIHLEELSSREKYHYTLLHKTRLFKWKLVLFYYYCLTDSASHSCSRNCIWKPSIIIARTPLPQNLVQLNLWCNKQQLLLKRPIRFQDSRNWF